MSLHKKLDIVFANGDGKRYIPRAHPERAAGSMGWLVYDQQNAEFLNERQVLAIENDALRNELKRPQ